MADDTAHMVPRVTALEEGLSTVRKEVASIKETLHSALLGTLDGKPGIVQTLHSSLEASRLNSLKLDTLTSTVTETLKLHSTQLEGMRLDKAKVTGIVITCSALWAALIAILGLMVKFWK